MKILTYDEEARELAVDVIAGGGVVVAPSVTNYGVFCDAKNATAIARIFEMKERTKFGPLTLGIAHPDEARTYAEVPDDISDECIASLLLGKTTTVFLKAGAAREFPEQMTMGAPTVGLFCHGESPMWEIGRDFGPIALTSSNISGTGGAQVTREQAINDLGRHVDLVIDGGPINWLDAAGQFQSNTVVDFSFAPPHLVRAGRFPTDQLKGLFPTLVTDFDAYKQVLQARMGAVRL